MASPVVLKVVASPPVSGHLPGTSSELVCTPHSNGPSSPLEPDSPIPLEATPLPSAVFSPKPENGFKMEKGPVESEEPIIKEVEPTAKEVEPTVKEVEPTAKEVEPTAKEVESTAKEVEPTVKEVEPTVKEVESTVKGVEPIIKEVEIIKNDVAKGEEAVIDQEDESVVVLEALPMPPELPSTEMSDVFHLSSQQVDDPLKAVQDVRSMSKRVSPPSLHANEEMLDDDSEEEMDTETSSQPSLAIPHSNPFQASSLPPTRSDSVSPYADDESFAIFVAQEANDTTSALDHDNNSSLSPSPTPTPSSNELLLPAVSYEGFSSSSSTSAMVKQFGVTASCPSTPLKLNEGVLNAPLDMTTHNFPKRSKYAHRAAISAMHPYNRTRGGGGASVAKTLDLLKAVLQPSFNMEVKRLCDDYRHIYAIAASNIRENTGDTVPQSTLKLLIMKMIEEAHQGYMNAKWEFPSGKLPSNEKVTSAKGSPMSTKKPNKTEKDSRYGPAKRQRKPPTERQNDKSSGWRWGMDRRRLDPVKWNPDKLDVSTDFVLGVNVNKALGHAANRGKVYYLHPELFKYACDGDDKTWLYENKHLPVHGGKAFLMIYSEVQALSQTEDCYKDNQDISDGVLKLQQFSVPQFMIDKMKKFMRSVQGYFTSQEIASSSSSTSASTVSTNAKS